MTDFSTLVLPAIAVSITVGAAAVFILLRSQLTNLWKTLLVPLGLLGSALLPVIFIYLIGTPLPALRLPDNSIYLSYQLVYKQGEKKKIQVWLVEKSDTRLYSVPYNKQLEKALKEAEAARRGGAQARLRHGKPRHNDSDESEYSIELDLPHDLLPPKAGEEDGVKRLPKAPLPGNMI